MDIFGTILAVILAAPAALFAYLKTKKGRAKTITWIKRLFNVDITADDLRGSIDNMSLAIDAQGNSINYLREQHQFLIDELGRYKEELSLARIQLQELDELHKENTGLKKRIKTLEGQIAKLEEELARRKKYTPKGKRVDNV